MNAILPLIGRTEAYSHKILKIMKQSCHVLFLRQVSLFWAALVQSDKL